MHMQARRTTSWKLPPAGLLMLAGAVWWLLLQINWTGAAHWLRIFLVFYGTWMMDP